MDKKTLCLYFQVHQPVRLKKYHFFDIGKSHEYYDDFANRTITQKVAKRCFIILLLGMKNSTLEINSPLLSRRDIYRISNE